MCKVSVVDFFGKVVGVKVEIDVFLFEFFVEFMWYVVGFFDYRFVWIDFVFDESVDCGNDYFLFFI